MRRRRLHTRCSDEPIVPRLQLVAALQWAFADVVHTKQGNQFINLVMHAPRPSDLSLNHASVHLVNE